MEMYLCDFYGWNIWGGLFYWTLADVAGPVLLEFYRLLGLCGFIGELHKVIVLATGLT